jgi:hypothetical protein
VTLKLREGGVERLRGEVPAVEIMSLKAARLSGNIWGFGAQKL